MYRRMLFALVVLAGAVRAGHATVTFEIRPPSEPIFYDISREPDEVKVLTRASGRVFATIESWGDGYDFRAIYFRGNAVVLNRQLKLMAALPGVPAIKAVPRVVLRDDDRPRQVHWLRQPIDLPEFDWCLHIDSHFQIGGAESGKLDVTVFIEVWPGESLAVDDLKLPPNLRLQSISRMALLAERHEADRLGSREAALKQHIRDLQDELATLERRRAATQPAPAPGPSLPAPAPPAGSGCRTEPLVAPAAAGAEQGAGRAIP